MYTLEMGQNRKMSRHMLRYPTQCASPAMHSQVGSRSLVGIVSCCCPASSPRGCTCSKVKRRRYPPSSPSRPPRPPCISEGGVHIHSCRKTHLVSRLSLSGRFNIRSRCLHKGCLQPLEFLKPTFDRYSRYSFTAYFQPYDHIPILLQ